MHRWLLLLALLAVASCRDSGATPPATTTTLPPETTTQPATTTTLGFEVPPVIDLPYVQRVLETLYHLDGEAARHAYAVKKVDAELYTRLEAIFGGVRLAEAKRILGENAAEGFVAFADPPGDPRVQVLNIMQATPACMVVRADLDVRPRYRAVLPKEPESVIQLGRAKVSPLNPTGWGIVGAGEPLPGQALNVCR